MASRNGLNPKIRGLKGVGFNRALPSSFGWGNGIWPDGTNDYLIVPKLIGKIIPPQFTVEYWSKFPDILNDLCGVFRFYGSGNSTIMIARAQKSPMQLQITIAEQGGADYCNIPTDTKKTMIAHSIDMLSGTASFYSPNTPVSVRSYSNLIPKAGTTIENFEFFTPGRFTTSFGNTALDEFRFYKKLITQAGFDTNYNAGSGNNPFETENLMVWFKFEKFEMLDFSELQDGSDMRLGIRDHSGNNYHAQPFNMDTNSASPTYVLKPF
ncbi:hypothetical protein ACFQZX_03980 [Mucilaginibacter litoreus]|uniref:Uncharacterized protein n=1 Tax=Mucilaginibacter litoreus TaxID=1048221 RepID=A0ABW3APH6_9SPHI